MMTEGRTHFMVCVKGVFLFHLYTCELKKTGIFAKADLFYKGFIIKQQSTVHIQSGKQISELCYYAETLFGKPLYIILKSIVL